MPLATTDPTPKAPLVKTGANPPTELLLTTRAIVAKDQELSALFQQFKKESKTVAWLRDVVVAPLASLVDDKYSFSQVREACEYLAEEYKQLPEGYFIVNTETGKVDAVFTEDDLMDPGLLPRESGEMAQALKRIRPDKEVSFVTYQHEKGREERTLKELARRYPQTQLQKEDGDNRFRMATRRGRTAIALDLSENDPREMLRRSGGTTGAFLRHFPLTEDEGTIKGTASYRSTVGVQDPLTVNVGYDHLGNLKGASAQGWVRSICLEVSQMAFKEVRPFPVEVTELKAEDLEGVDLWIADPNVLFELKRINPKLNIVPVPGAATLGLKGVVGSLKVDSSFQVETHERFKFWEVVSNVGYSLNIESWDSVRVMNVLGIAAHAELA